MKRSKSVIPNSLAIMQSGYALLLFLLVLIGVGGVVLSEVMRDTEKQIILARAEKNNRVLQAAKQALLQYAYQYPQIKSNGPGRLPCPDDDNDGKTGSLSRVLCQSVGRLPWKTAALNFFDARDADNERLWYAVSSHFYNLGGGSDINSDSYGSITLTDQVGNMIYAGDTTLAKSGVAAVIIAPGAPLAGQNRHNDPLDPVNFLDRFNGFDNSRFNNAESDTHDDGFMLGPVFDPVQNTIVVNDQFVIVTAAEVIAQAEKATLQIYRDAIRRYLHNTGNHYPWLFSYDTDDLDIFRGTATTVSGYPEGRLTTIGRIPSIFSDYFSDADSEPIETELRLAGSKSYTVNGNHQTLIFEALSANILTDVEFLDLERRTDDQIALNTTNTTEPIYIEDRYYYFSDVWLPCSGGADDLADCNRDENGELHALPNQYASTILRVGISLDFSGLISIGLDVGNLDSETDITYSKADVEHHAMVNARFPGYAVSGLPIDFFYEKITYSDAVAFDTVASGIQNVSDDSDFPDVTEQSLDNIEIGMRYYPELPRWAKTKQNNWHNSIMMAIADHYKPGLTSVESCQQTVTCLSVDDMSFGDNKASLLVLAGQVFDHQDDGINGFVDELSEIFDPENADLDTTYRQRQGNDIVLVVRSTEVE